VLALGAAVQRRGIDRMPGTAQPARHALPDPAALIGTVDQARTYKIVSGGWRLSRGKRSSGARPYHAEMCQSTKSLRDRQLKWDHGRGD